MIARSDLSGDAGGARGRGAGCFEERTHAGVAGLSLGLVRFSTELFERYQRSERALLEWDLRIAPGAFTTSGYQPSPCHADLVSPHKIASSQPFSLLLTWLRQLLWHLIAGPSKPAETARGFIVHDRLIQFIPFGGGSAEVLTRRYRSHIRLLPRVSRARCFPRSWQT